MVYLDDLNSYIKMFTKENESHVELLEKTNWNNKDVTYGIIFGDDEEFIEQIYLLTSNNITLWTINIK